MKTETECVSVMIECTCEHATVCVLCVHARVRVLLTDIPGDHDDQTHKHQAERHYVSKLHPQTQRETVSGVSVGVLCVLFLTNERMRAWHTSTKRKHGDANESAPHCVINCAAYTAHAMA
jgi:hypothetical protein